MRHYKCHKEVEAAPVHSVDTVQCIVFTDGGDSATVVEENFFGRGCPSPGDYLVKYLPDGYLSWSPKSVFEDGYTLKEA